MQQIAPYYRQRLILISKARPLRDVLNNKPFRFGLSDENINHLIENKFIKIWGNYGLTNSVNDNSIIEYQQHIHESPHNLPNKLTFLKIYPFNPKGLYAIDKPSCCVVHPVQRYYYGTIQKQVEQELGLQLNCINRLDRLTSGVLIMGDENWTKRLKNEEWDKDKQYLALVEGEFPERIECNDDLIYIYLTRHMIRRYRPARTTFERIKYHNGKSLILASLKSGFPHQIRIHLRNLGFPISGDPLYGKEGKYREALRKKDDVDDEYLELMKQRSEDLETGKRVPDSEPCSECFAINYKMPTKEGIPLHAWKYHWRQGSEHFQVHTELPNWAQKFLASSC